MHSLEKLREIGVKLRVVLNVNEIFYKSLRLNYTKFKKKKKLKSPTDMICLHI